MGEQIDIKALLAEAEALEKDAHASDLSADERAHVEALARIQAARETKAANAAKRRAVEMGLREAAIRKTFTDGTLVKAIDLYSLFPLGAEPSHMPACGFAILRNPTPQASAKKDASVQAGDKTAHEVGIEFVSACIVFPSGLSEDAVSMGEFLRAHAEATGELVKEARELGGAKSRARPLGRA